MTNRIDQQIDDMFKLLDMSAERNPQVAEPFRSLLNQASGGTRIYESEEAIPNKELPYPWCRGNPTKQDCMDAGYCRRDPNCGE